MASASLKQQQRTLPSLLPLSFFYALRQQTKSIYLLQDVVPEGSLYGGVLPYGQGDGGTAVLDAGVHVLSCTQENTVINPLTIDK